MHKMARITKGILGGFSGKVGNYCWRKLARTGHYQKYSQTKLETAHRQTVSAADQVQHGDPLSAAAQKYPDEVFRIGERFKIEGEYGSFLYHQRSVTDEWRCSRTGI